MPETAGVHRSLHDFSNVTRGADGCPVWVRPAILSDGSCGCCGNVPWASAVGSRGNLTFGWLCSHCGNNNYKNRVSCFRCRTVLAQGQRSVHLTTTSVVKTMTAVSTVTSTTTDSVLSWADIAANEGGSNGPSDRGDVDLDGLRSKNATLEAALEAERQLRIEAEARACALEARAKTAEAEVEAHITAYESMMRRRK